MKKGKARGKDSNKAELYDVKSDVGEKSNVIVDLPEVAKRLRQLDSEFKQELAKNSRPAAFVKNPKPLRMK